MFQIPVATSTAKAAQGDLVEAAGDLGDDARPAQDRDERGQHQLAADPRWVAARTCRKRRMVSQLTASIPYLPAAVRCTAAWVRKILRPWKRSPR